MIYFIRTIGLTLQAHQLVVNRRNWFILTMFYLCYIVPADGKQPVHHMQYDELTQKNVYAFVEEMPLYKTGDKGFMCDFDKYFDFCSSQFLNDEIQTKLNMQFVIDENGHLIGARIYNKSNNELTVFEKAGIKAINSMQNWKAGVHKEKSVNVIITKIININMKSSEK